MNIAYTDAAKQDGDQYELLQQATRQLEEILGQSASLISARWDRTEGENGRTLYRLELEDSNGTLATSFAPDELYSSPQRAFRLHRIWGDLLQVRNERQLEKLIGRPG